MLDPADAHTDEAFAAKRRSHAPLLWVIIAMLTAAVFLLQQQSQAPPPLEAAPPNPKSVTSLPVLLNGRILVGMELLAPGSGTTSAIGSPDEIIQRLDETSPSPIDKIRIACVVGEIRGPLVALARLGGVRDDLNAQLSQTAPPPTPEQQAAFTGLLDDVRGLRTAYLQGSDAVDAAAADDLIARHHWFAQLALSHDRPSTDPRRAAVLGAAVRTIVAVSIGAIVVIGALALGFVMFIIAAVLAGGGMLRTRFPATAGDPARMGDTGLEAFALFLGGFILVQAVAAGLTLLLPGSPVPGLVGLALQWSLAACIVWPVLRGVPWRDARRALGWHAGAGAANELGAGVLGYLAGLPIVLLGGVCSLVLIFLLGADPSHPASDGLAGAGALQIVLLLSLGAVWAPVVEESMFRGALYHRLRRRLGPIVAALISAFIFAVIHPQGIALVPALMSLAVVFALLREWRGSIIAPMLAHAMHNAFILTLITVATG